MAARSSAWLRRFESLIVPRDEGRRFTQDSPIYEDVWMAYAGLTASDQMEVRVDLLLAVHVQATAPELTAALQARLRVDWDRRLLDGAVTLEAPKNGTTQFGLSYIESQVVVRLNLGELVRVVLPLTNWWQSCVFRPPPPDSKCIRLSPKDLPRAVVVQLLIDWLPKRQLLAERGESIEGYWLTPDLLWLVDVVGSLTIGPGRKPHSEDVVKAFVKLLLGGVDQAVPPRALAWSINRNRAVKQSLEYSVITAKADAARTLFHPDCSQITWAVVDSGVDAAHVAFRRRDSAGVPRDVAFVIDNNRTINNTRVAATYDFTRMRELIEVPVLSNETNGVGMTADDLVKALQSGRSIDWSGLDSRLLLQYDPAHLAASAPVHEHGTHVGGTLAGDWRDTDDPPAPSPVLQGMCPSLSLFDLRVFGPDGNGDEYSILAALQFIRYLNAGKDQLLIHGVNMSFSIKHDAANFACGRTPVCEESERLVHSGVVVVAAAGNLGYARFQTEKGERSDGCRIASITDPGNAELVITVGATHRIKPHQYGVSYFSSRGPTADGRCKPDLVAPGEKVIAPTPGGKSRAMDGTSMAAPHVSGAAALLMARYPELIRRPDVVKAILMRTATDLGRERNFQGAGLVDVLRAMQAV